VPVINPTLPIVGQPNATEEPKIVTALSQLVATINAIDSSNIADGSILPDDMQSAFLDKLGASSASVIRRGQSSIVTTESRTNAAYGLMTTPDQVSNLVLPTNGVLIVGFQAVWNEGVVGAARAALFLGANQVKIPDNSQAAPIVQEASVGIVGATGVDKPLSTFSGGLAGSGGNTTAYTGDVTTGQIIAPNGVIGQAGPCWIRAAAGTYTVSVQFKASSGAVAVKNRTLWVLALGF
jgi:hypothetical protein